MRSWTLISDQNKNMCLRFIFILLLFFRIARPQISKNVKTQNMDADVFAPVEMQSILYYFHTQNLCLCNTSISNKYIT